MTVYYSVDVESWAHSSRPRFARLSSAERKRLDGGATRCQLKNLLKMTAQHGARLSFFVTGEVFDWYPELIEQIAASGHEIGFHTQRHQRLLSIADLESEIDAASRFITQWRPLGFRAPLMKMIPGAYGLLLDAGFTYSSSIYAPDNWIIVDGIVEIPVSTQSRFQKQLTRTCIPSQMTPRLWCTQIPYGSAYMLGLCGWRRVDKHIEDRRALGFDSNLFVHNWQLFSHDRSAVHQYIETLRNPLHLPYARIVANDFLELMKRHEFERLDHHPALTRLNQALPSALSQRY